MRSKERKMKANTDAKSGWQMEGAASKQELAAVALVKVSGTEFRATCLDRWPSVC